MEALKIAHTPANGSVVCSRCGVSKLHDAEHFYYKRQVVRRDGQIVRLLSKRCKACEKEASNLWRLNHLQQFKETRRIYQPFVGANKRRHLLKAYSITPDVYAALLESQNYRCAICAKPESDNNAGPRHLRLSVDHDHDTQRIRGLLCNDCNRGIGFLKDSSIVAEKALAYLRHHGK